IFVGKTNTPEHGLGTLTYNGIFGPTVTPWNTRKNAGGSSGGAGAAVAAGMLPFADGSDRGGSIRYPARVHNLVRLPCSAGAAPLRAPRRRLERARGARADRPRRGRRGPPALGARRGRPAGAALARRRPGAVRRRATGRSQGAADRLEPDRRRPAGRPRGT